MIAHNLSDREYLALNGNLSLDRIERLLDRNDELEKLYQDLVDFWTDEMLSSDQVDVLFQRCAEDYKEAFGELASAMSDATEKLAEILEIDG